MYCSRCGAKVEDNQKFCNKCGNKLINSQIKNSNKKMIFIGLGVGIGILTIIIIVILMHSKHHKNYYSKNIYENYEEENKTVEIKKDESKSKNSKYRTVIIADNTYAGVEISNDTDAYNLIIEDSIKQKDTTSKDIKNIEESIINKYGITAVNLCEMNVELAQEIENVLAKIYNEYPTTRKNITNLSLVNGSMSENYIAVFMPLFNFATSNSETTYPWVMKTQILLNTTYFLNPTRLESSVTDGSNTGHFPPNATIYSPVAHEFGHYLSFLALLNNYNTESILLIDNNKLDVFTEIYTDFANGEFSLKMINEAYENYKKDITTNLTLDEWRATISSYAVAKDNSGNYIYDETIAEAFHDVYLNEENAKEASKYIINVLKKYLES